MDDNTNICFCIPARYDSKRLYGKLLLNINGMTCIERTIKQTLKSEYATTNNVYVMTDSKDIETNIKNLGVQIILTTQSCCNGTDRISKHLHLIPKKYTFIVDIQADEPFISPLNIDNAILKHIEHNSDKVYYTTLHETRNEIDVLKSTATLKVVTDINNNAILYSRNIIPWNKNGEILTDYVYKTFTGIYIFNRNHLESYQYLKNTPLQMIEDCEQLKIIENGYLIKSFPTIEYNEISLNTKEDYDYLINKYFNNETVQGIKFVVFDLDGVFTDGKIYASESGQMKCYNGKDTYGLKLLKNKNIKLGLITAHDFSGLSSMCHIVDRMDYISKGKYDKLVVLKKWLTELNIDLNNVAYIGDDLPDIPILKSVKFSACPSNAVHQVIKSVDYVCKNKSGDGAVREFCEIILSSYITS